MSDSVWPHRPPGSPVPGILQARTLEWVAISFSNAWKWKAKVKSLSCIWLLATPWTAAHQAPRFMGFSRQEYWSGVPLPSPITLIRSPLKRKKYNISLGWLEKFKYGLRLDNIRELLILLCVYMQIINLFSSVQFSCSVVSDSLWPHESQHTMPPCPSPTPGVHSDSRPSSQSIYYFRPNSPFSSCSAIPGWTPQAFVLYNKYDIQYYPSREHRRKTTGGRGFSSQSQCFLFSFFLFLLFGCQQWIGWERHQWHSPILSFNSTSWRAS